MYTVFVVYVKIISNHVFSLRQFKKSLIQYFRNILSIQYLEE